MTLAQKPFGALRSYGRIKGRGLKPRQAAMLKAGAERLMLPDPAEGPIEPKTLMPNLAATWLEIGFGGGEHMAEQAARRPDVLILGAEPFLNGVASAVRHVEEGALSNVRILQGDARALLAVLPDASLTRIFVMFPDPWPKTRHHKRRLIQDDVLAEMARTLVPGGGVRFATDWAEYADWALERFLRSPDFRWSAERADDWRTPPADHVTTRYETKRLGDCDPVFLDFVRQ